MTKKIFIILIGILALFSMQKIYAIDVSDEVQLKGKERLESPIEVNENGEEWTELKVDKYSEDNGIIYKLGNKEASENNMTISMPVQDNTIDTILANGYGMKSPEKLGLDNENDAYIATKIALDCVNKGIDKSNIKNYFREKENLDDISKARANKILDAVKKLLSIPKDDYFGCGYILKCISDMKQDEFNENYCSMQYEIDSYNCVPLGYTISDYSGFISEVFSTNNKGERKDEFTFKDDTNIFRIVIPKEYKEAVFVGSFQLDIEVQKKMAFFGKSTSNKYIIVTDMKIDMPLEMNMNNKRSGIDIKVTDEESEEAIQNVKLKIKDENNLIDDVYTTNENGKISITGLGKGYVQMEILEMPEDYTTDEDILKEEVPYAIYCNYNIYLNHKKGILQINTNLKGSVFKIYDKDSKYIGTYTTGEDGKIKIDKMNIGDGYILKQVSVPEGYKLINDTKFSILHNETTTLDIINEKIQNEETKKPDEDANAENKQKEEEKQNDDLEGKFETKDPEDVGGAIVIPQKENNKKDENQNTDENIEKEQEDKNKEESKQEEIEKNEEIKSDNEEQDKSEGKLENKVDNTKNHNDNKSDSQNVITNKGINSYNTEYTSSNKLPRTGYDFLVEIEPLHIIFVILILLYILKRTTKSQSH